MAMSVPWLAQVVARYSPSDWSNSQNGVQEKGWARFRFSLLFNKFDLTKPKSKMLKMDSPSRLKREPRPWRPPQLRTPVD